MNITVYCGSSFGNNPGFKESAVELGKWMAENGHRLVYGAGKVGMMGIIADAVLDNGGEAVGVTPGFFIDKDEIHAGLTELLIVHNLSERRTRMMELGDAFIALPGGMGTLDEITEICANNRLRQFNGGTRPAILLNTDGYYDKLMEYLKNMVDKGFYKQSDLDAIVLADSIDDIAEALK